MSYKRELDKEVLAARLRAVLPDYRPLAEWSGKTPGTFKGIDSQGNVYLVTWDTPITDANGVFWQRRKKKLVLKADEGEMAPAATHRRRQSFGPGPLD